MQPSSGSPQYPPPSGYAGAPYDPSRDPSRDQTQRPGFVTPPPSAGIVRVNAWLTGVIAAVLMLVLIAGISNQGVTDQIRKHSLNPQKFFDNIVQATTVYAWRFKPQLSTDFGHIWIAGIVFDLLVVVLTLLITVALVKNKRGFGGAFLAAWVAVFVATQVSSYVRATIVDVNQLQAQQLSKPVEIFFAPYSPGTYSVFAGLMFGLFPALIAGAIGAATRRTEVLAAPVPVFTPVPQPDEAPQPRDNQQPWTAPPPPGPISSPSPWTTAERSDLAKNDDEPQRTAVLPVMDERRSTAAPADSQATTQFPAYGERGGTEPEPTQAYRVPPEDETR